jgi:hypothetical protein
MEGLLVVLTVFSMPVAIVAVVSHYRLKAKQLAAGGNPEEQKRLQAKYDELEQRMQTLETIVCEGDVQAAEKLRALVGASARALPAKKPE